jgi:glucokinase
MSDRRCVIGIDLGGTNVRAQALYENGTPAGARQQHPSNAQEGKDEILDSLIKAIQGAIESSEVKPEAIGLAMPGHIDDESGLVLWSPNFGQSIDGVFHCWNNVQIKQPLEEASGIPVCLANDANCAALGEYRFGTGKGDVSSLVLLTLGTGVGGGVVLGPRSLMGGGLSGPQLLLGGNKGGCELGHLLIRQGGLDCNAGSYGALEAYCQRDSIITRAIYRLRRGRESIIPDLVNGDISKITPQILTMAADQGDKTAIDIWREVGIALGAGMGTLINIFAPEVFAVGGQIAKSGKWLMEPAITECRYVAIPSLFNDVKITQAEMIDDAGVLGGAAIALEMLN